MHYIPSMGFPGDPRGKEPACQCRRPKRHGLDPCGKIPRRRPWQPTLVFLPREYHEQRKLASYGLQCHEESDSTERLHFHFSLSCTEGNGNPLQCSCLENRRNRGAWWAAVYGVAQSQTRLKRLSSSSLLIPPGGNRPWVPTPSAENL